MSFIEAQIGDYFGEDDIEGLEDDKGRADGAGGRGRRHCKLAN